MFFGRVSWFIFVFLVMSGVAGTTSACGPDSDCQIGDRHYRIRMPAGQNGETPVGAIVFAHGYRGGARAVMSNSNLAEVASRLGVALIAVKSSGDDWSIPNAPSHATEKGVDEFAYIDAVLADASSRFPIDRTRLMASGFSAGGMMVWNLACYRADSFAAFVPIAGTFWAPIPDDCDLPVANIIHLHGDADQVVPLDGRPIGDARQGAVQDALDMYGHFGGFGPVETFQQAGFTCRDRVSESGDLLRFCLFPGGHNFQASLIEMAWNMFADRGRF